jgi:Flp pilus assembly protein TadG
MGNDMINVRGLYRRLNPRLKWRGVRGLRYDERGVSAVEFAMIAPVLVLIYLGCVELSLMMRVDRRVTSTSAALGDLTARLTVVTEADMEEMYNAAAVMMQPYDMDTTRMRITSIVDTGDGSPTVDWSDAHNMTAYANGATVTVPAGIIPSPGSVIMAEVEYDYEGTFAVAFETSRTLKDKFYLRPRRVSTIPREDEGAGFGPTS